LQYEPYFATLGLDLVMWSFLHDRDLKTWYGKRHINRLAVIVGAVARIPAALRLIQSAHLVIVQREALPFGPPLLERWAARRRPVVWDVDDAVWESFVSPTAGHLPRWVRATGGKYRRICKVATEVWAGSDVLATWCQQHNQRVAVIPTVVPVPQTRPSIPKNRTVSWIGSHSTGPFVQHLLPALRNVQPALDVVVVGAAVEVPDGVQVRQLAWSEQVEASIVRSSRVGLYPIDRTHPLAEGKCGLKAILYMAQGVPPVVTPTATNAKIVRNGVDGLYAEDRDGWVRAVSSLLADDAQWERMSSSAHARARADYSTEVWGPRVAARALDLASPEGR
jgi:glycosyltransferase involved in cell wall biosynthesis